MLARHRQALAQSRPTQSSNQTTADIVEVLAAAVPELFSGAPDLEGPTNCKRALSAFTGANPAGRYLHYGIREHAMGAIMNGIVAHGGLLPLGATYLVFSDYMRPALRMSALMDLPVITIYSHDSIGIGRNGPTHQPARISRRPARHAEHGRVPAGRRRGDGRVLELALQRRHGPSSMICSRQALPPVRDDAGIENRSARGAYVLAEACWRATGDVTCDRVRSRAGARGTRSPRGARDRDRHRLHAVLGAHPRRSRPTTRVPKCSTGYDPRRHRGGRPFRLGPLARRQRRLHSA